MGFSLSKNKLEMSGTLLYSQGVLISEVLLLLNLLNATGRIMILMCLATTNLVCEMVCESVRFILVCRTHQRRKRRNSVKHVPSRNKLKLEDDRLIRWKSKSSQVDFLFLVYLSRLRNYCHSSPWHIHRY